MELIYNGKSKITEGKKYINSIEFCKNLRSNSFEKDENLADKRIIISVDCKLRENHQIQKFGGIQIYLKLLQIHNNRSDSHIKPFNVILYSVLSIHQLVTICPQNQILKNTSIKFIQLREDQNFENNVNEIFSRENNLISYSVAADNLLRGLHFQNEENKNIQDEESFDSVSIRIPEGKKLMIIDDFFDQYEWVYKQIIENYESAVVIPQTEILASWREDEVDEEEVINHILNIVDGENPDFILSDFYIGERHKDTKSVKNVKDVQGISGYKVFRRIKEKYPWIPYMIFTTSNKIWNYDLMRQEGIWYWSVKDTRVNLSKQELKEYYFNFKKNLDKIMSNEWQLACKIWKRFASIKIEDYNNIYTPGQAINIKGNPDDQDAVRDRIYEIFQYLLDIYKKLEYGKNYKVPDRISRQLGLLIIDIGSICEGQGFHYTSFNLNRINHIGCYLYLLRSFYAHRNFILNSTPIEVIFCLDQLVNLIDPLIDIPRISEQISYNQMSLYRKFRKIKKEERTSFFRQNSSVKDLFGGQIEPFLKNATLRNTGRQIFTNGKNFFDAFVELTCVNYAVQFISKCIKYKYPFDLEIVKTWNDRYLDSAFRSKKDKILRDFEDHPDKVTILGEYKSIVEELA